MASRAGNVPIIWPREAPMRQFTSDGYWRSLLRGGMSKVFLLQAMREGPGHGYELNRRIAVVSGGFCQTTYSAIYPALRAFERDGCAVSRIERVGRRRRRIYELTPKGRRALQAALAACEDTRDAIRRALSRIP
jgi:PadR family transcriptional regulator, regulatory protein PadR